MNITCDIAMDLADIYSSGAASEDTTEAVESHLKNCESCRSFYREYKREQQKKSPQLRLETSGIEDELISKNVQQLSKRLRTRDVIRTVCAVITAVFGLATLLYDVIDDYKKND